MPYVPLGIQRIDDDNDYDDGCELAAWSCFIHLHLSTLLGYMECVDQGASCAGYAEHVYTGCLVFWDNPDLAITSSINFT